MSHSHLGTLVTEDLTRELDILFPDRCARKGMTPEDIWMEAGSRKVIECLKAARKDFEDNILQP